MIYKNVNCILSEKQRRLQKKPSERYQGLSGRGKTKSVNVLMKDLEILLKIKKTKKSQHGRERFKNLHGDEKQRLVEWKKKYSRM